MLPFEKVTKHRFNQKTYSIVWRRPYDRTAEGICTAPHRKPEERRIMVNPRLPAKDFMEVLLHESLHAEQWYLDEETVQRMGIELSELLWKCGFRLTDAQGKIVEWPKEPLRPKKAKKETAASPALVQAAPAKKPTRRARRPSGRGSQNL